MSYAKRLKAVAIIQARMTSTRFPKKILQPLGRKPVLQWVIDGVKKAKEVDKVVIASPHKIPGFKSFVPKNIDENNVLSRIYLCAKKYKADLVVRITADCPLIDPYWIDFCVRVMRVSDYDFMCNTPYCADGLDVEVYRMTALERAYKEATDPQDREHCHPYIRRTMKICEIDDKIKRKQIKISIDTPEDLERVRRICGLPG